MKNLMSSKFLVMRSNMFEIISGGGKKVPLPANWHLKFLHREVGSWPVCFCK